MTKEAFVQLLRKQNINVVFRENDQGLTYGLTFIDHHNKTVFNGSDLGKYYSAKAITARFVVDSKQADRTVPSNSKPQHMEPKPDLLSKESNNLLETLMAKPDNEGAPLLPNKKKKRRRGFRL